MVKKISQSELDRFSSEDSTRVLTKRRAIAEVPEIEEQDDKVIADAILESNQQVIAAINNIKMPEGKVQPMIDNLHVNNIERNADGRIESADFAVTYREMH